jgi:quercetin dioxygenase-like cupin family protein
MSTTMKMQKKSLNSADEVRNFEKGRIEITKFDIVKTNSCEAPHTSVIISGRLKVRMDDGTEAEGGPGDVAVIPPGHNAWVVGDEPCVMIDFTGAKNYAK